ncbi:MAG: glycosyltransferase, partial [Deltaproteobacteria bacterium]|nr:glycosyltransferase [Deltaproteobacteria bacterium]
MKVALVRQRYTDFGGAERYTSALAEHLIDSGHEVHVFAHEWKGKKDSGKGGGIVFHRVPMLKGLSVLEVLSFAVNSRRMLKRERFDIIQSFERTLYQGIYRAGDGCHREWLIQRRKIDPWYKTITQAINPLHLGLLRIERELFREGNYRAIIAISKRGKEEIITHYGVPPEKITVIY